MGRHWKNGFEFRWTNELRCVLYTRLLHQFGPAHEWQKRVPGRGLDKKFNRFCKVFAEAVGAKSEDAIKQQIAYAMPDYIAKRTLDPSRTKTALLNKTIAAQCGFIRLDEINSLFEMLRKRS